MSFTLLTIDILFRIFSFKVYAMLLIILAIFKSIREQVITSDLIAIKNN